VVSTVFVWIPLIELIEFKLYIEPKTNYYFVLQGVLIMTELLINSDRNSYKNSSLIVTEIVTKIVTNI
jgi:hypothetical protein